MNRKLVIKIKKPSQAELLLWIILILPFLFGALIELLRLPAVIKYICDVAWLWLLLLIAMQRRKLSRDQRMFRGFVVAFLMYALLGNICHLQSPLYFLWGVRNNFRVYVVFLALIAFGNPESNQAFLDMFDRVFWINAVVCLVQFFVLDKKQDYLGGIFGVEKGCNGYLNNFFVIVTAMNLLQYLSGNKTLLECASKCGTMLIISALAELKFYYVEFTVIVIMAVLLTAFSWKKIFIIAGGFVGVTLAVQLLVSLFPEFENFLSWEIIRNAATSDSGYTGRGDVDRLTAIPSISERFLKTFPEQLVGLGLGNCDTAGFEILKTPFYTKYFHLNYLWFSVAAVFLEMGYTGLGFFFGFFLLVFFKARKLSNEQGQNKMYCQMAMICAICCILIGIYNSSLRTEAGYMMYFVLALPFARNRVPAQQSDRIYDSKQDPSALD